MSDSSEQARIKLEQAISEWVQAFRDDDPNMLVTNYVLIVASESMEDSEHTFFNYKIPQGTPKYMARGLLTEAMEHYKSDSR